jgi:hypothetical protein
MTQIGNFEIKLPPEQAWEEFATEMRRIEAGLSPDKEIGIVANGADRAIHVADIRWTGQLIVFSGTDSDGHDATLIQHHTQLSVQVIAVDKLQARAKRIGF